MKKKTILVFGVVIGGLLGYFLYLWLGGTPTTPDAFETDASELCTPITTETFGEETVIVYMCKSLRSIDDMFFSIFLIALFMFASFILGFCTGKSPEGVKK